MLSVWNSISTFPSDVLNFNFQLCQGGSYACDIEFQALGERFRSLSFSLAPSFFPLPLSSFGLPPMADAWWRFFGIRRKFESLKFIECDRSVVHVQRRLSKCRIAPPFFPCFSLPLAPFFSKVPALDEISPSFSPTHSCGSRKKPTLSKVTELRVSVRFLCSVCCVLSAACCVLDTVSKVPCAQCRMSSVVCWILWVECWMSSAGHCMLCIECYVLCIGYCE